MSGNRRDLAGMSPAEAADHVMNNDISDLLDQAEHLTERRPAKMVTALRIDLDTQAALETAAAARGTGVTTLMRQIIEDWVRANHDGPAPDHISELVRHLDAARMAALKRASMKMLSAGNLPWFRCSARAGQEPQQGVGLGGRGREGQDLVVELCSVAAVAEDGAHRADPVQSGAVPVVRRDRRTRTQRDDPLRRDRHRPHR